MLENERNERPGAALSWLRWNRKGSGILLDRLQPPAELVLIGTALLVGLGAGIGAVLFRYLINGVEWVGYQWMPSVIADWGKAYVVIVPAIGGLLVGLLVYFFASEARGHGVPEVMAAVALRDGRIRPVVAVVKALASALSIGSGGSVGREGPIVQIGSALGSSLGQALHLSGDRVRNLVACGAAGGIAATFNAPIAGVMFALEVILGQFNVRHFSSVVVAAVAASVVGRAAFGDFPAFSVPFEYGITSLWEFLFYPILGIAAALTGVTFTRLLYWSEDRFDNWKRVPEWFQPAIGGALLGGLALLYPSVTGVEWQRVPQVFNVGYNVIEAALANQLVLGTVLALLLLKMLATSLTLGSGGSGGIFAPSLFMGAMLGASFELLINQFFPEQVAPAGAYALVGMAAVFAASAHAPITAVLILFELTGDYQIILPLMLTVVVATLVGQRLLRGESIYTLKLTRRGIRLLHGRQVDLMQGVTVREAMTRDAYVVEANAPLEELGRYFEQTHAHSFPVVDESSELVGMVSIRDYENALFRPGEQPRRLVKDIATMGSLLIAYEDESLASAIQRIGIRGVNKLPVVNRNNPRKIIGVVRHRDIVRAYNLAIAKRAQGKMDDEKMRLGETDDFDILDVRIAADSRAAHQTIAQLSSSLPHDSVMISIRRHANLLIPHGDTILYPGDLVKVIVRQAEEADLRECLLGRPGEKGSADAG
jgi:CIC family chloride channel protein